MRIDKLFLNLYLIAAIVHIYAVAAMMYNAEVITKYLLMPFLVLCVVFSARKNLSKAVVLILALVFCWFGDILLLYTSENETYFIPGLGAFLIGHLFYIFSFRKYRDQGQPQGFKKIWLLPIVLYSAVLLVYLIPKLEDMLIPVILYAIVITIMTITALQRWDRTREYSFGFVLTGAVLFMISDSLIALNKFAFSITNSSLLIMITYIVAQYLIVNGCLLHLKEEE